MSYWRDKVAIVTGGSAGLGRAVVERLADLGAKVAVVARGRERLEAFCNSLQARGADVLACGADITVQGEVDAAVSQTMDRFKRIDLMVNCAGRSTRAAILDTTPEELQALLEINFLATVRMTRACAAHLLAAGGHVVNIGSLASKTAGPFLGAYPATKHALAAYTQQLRLELGPRGLHVLLVCPGPIARDETGPRYAERADVPAEARAPGGGAKVRAMDPLKLAGEILRACERRQAELVRPRRARVLFAAAALSPRLGDWLVRKFTGGEG
jgi:short-subunit dehydrogenase